MKEKILIVDDDDSLRRVMEYNLEQEGYEVYSVASGEEGLASFKNNAPDLVITDIKMPGMDGIQLLSEIMRLNTGALVIVITAYGDVDTAVEAMKMGAYDYITKPFSRDHLKILVEKALKFESLTANNRWLRQQLAEKFSFENIVGGSSRMTEVFEVIRRVAPSDVTVLVQGESGTGKELVAKAIHFNSPRAEENFVTVNCSAIPEHLMESELFGHEKGAFTGAVAARTGKFELANGGTVFLDEIGDLRPDLQAKILRVLQEKEIDKVGSDVSLKVDIRVIAATNRDLEQAVSEGSFREDLFYRLNVVPITLPPLRERKEDIALLVQHFKHRFGGNDCQIERDTLDTLMAYPWPGNVRELENVLQRALLLRKDPRTLTPEDLPDNISAPVAKKVPWEIPEEGIRLDEVERDLILQSLKKKGWNQTQAAKLLGISRQTLIYRMSKYGIPTKPGKA